MSLFPCSVLNICPSLVSTRLAACARPSIRGNEQNDGHETRWRSWKEKEQKPFVVCKLLSSFSLTKSLEHASENLLLLPQPQKEVTTVPTLLPKCQGNRIKHLPYRAARQRKQEPVLNTNSSQAPQEVEVYLGKFKCGYRIKVRQYRKFSLGHKRKLCNKCSYRKDVEPALPRKLTQLRFASNPLTPRMINI